MPSSFRLALPEALQQKLLDFRSRVWWTKSIEALAFATFGVIVGFGVVYLLDRLWNTSSQLRGGVLLTAMAACLIVPWSIYRWVWRHRRLDQLAMLLRKRHPAIGDQLLGIIELVRNDAEQQRSRELCEAAVEQVSKSAQRRDLSDAVPTPRHRLFGGMAIGAVVAAVVIAGLTPAAASNAWARYLMPWRETPRYTFTKVEPLPAQRIVAHGEPFTLQLKLQPATVWHPETAHVQFAGFDALEAMLSEAGTYLLECPPLIAANTMRIDVGDFAQEVQIEPKLRPELTAVTANISLPAYLRRDEDIKKDVRGGSGTLVKGSQLQVVATASRPLAEASIDDAATQPEGDKVRSEWSEVSADRALAIRWQDEFGLEGQRPFTLALHSRDDEAPSIACTGLSRRQVVLDSEVLNFQLRGIDDFGVKVVGIEWQGLDTTMKSNPAAGERVLGAGSPTAEEVDLNGTFSAKSLGIEPQPLEVRMFVEDFYPNRERVYSSPYVLYVLTPEEHAIWITDQMSKWHRNSLEVRDRELQLYETNRQLQTLTAQELDDPQTRREIEKQAAAERANGRRLARLAEMGEGLVKQASRNDEIGVGHLEKWAEMLQILKDISANRMPSVAQLLDGASESELAGSPSSKPQTAGPQAGQNRSPAGGGPSEDGESDGPPKPPVPTIVDGESSQQPLDADEKSAPPGSGKSSPRLGLPVTTLVGGGPSGESCPAAQQVEEAVEQQRDLLNEFDKIAEELNKVLANLEGSTLVKRLKAASRVEYQIAGRLGDNVHDSFGLKSLANAQVASLYEDLVKQQAETGHTVSYIMDDMQAYYERRRMSKFKLVLEEMREEDVLGSLRDVSDELKVESGLAIAQCEFWSDTLDRWAEDLVDPAGGGT